MNSPRFLSFAVLTAAAVSAPLWVRGQPSTPNPAAGKDLIAPAISAVEKTTDITSTSMDLWGTDTQTEGVFTGNVVVTGTNMKLTCDRLQIIASRIGDKTVTIGKLDKFKYLLATGNVHMVQGDREAFCGRAELYPREDRIVLTEKPVAIDHGSDATYTGDELDLYRGERRVKGKNVKLTFPPIKDLGFDKNKPAPTSEGTAPTRPGATTDAANAPAGATQNPATSPTPTPAKPASDSTK
jgi:lipopolysaccharide export system protein LptA